MKSLLTISLVLISLSSWAQFDLSANANARSWPSISGAAGVDLGYNLPLWGEISKTNPMYGLLRLQASADTSVVVNSTDYRLSFYPISFVALGAGRSELKSSYDDFDYFDCEEVRCEGNLNKDYIFGKTILAYNSYVASFFYRVSRNSYNDPDKTNLPVGEYSSVNIVQAGDEVSVLRSYFLGYTMGEKSFGFFSEQLEFLDSDQQSELNALIYRTKDEKWQYTYGVGSQHSSVEKAQVTVFIDITFEFMKNNAIF